MKKLLGPSQNPKKIIYNKTFFGITLNIFLGIARFNIFVYTLLYFSNTLLYSLINMSNKSAPYIYIIIVQFFVIILILFDCIIYAKNSFGEGTFSDRVFLSKFAHYSGLGGIIGLYCFRTMLYSVLFLCRNYITFNNYSIFKKINDFQPNFSVSILDRFLSQDLLLFYGFAIYSIITLIYLLSSLKPVKELEHPWISPYVPDLNELVKKKYANYGVFNLLLLILNTTFLIYILFIYCIFIVSNDTLWKLTFMDYFDRILMPVVILLLIVKQLYVTLRDISILDISGNFLTISWYAAYIICVMEVLIQEEIFEKKIWNIILFTILSINLAYSLFIHPLLTLSKATFYIKNIFSIALVRELSLSIALIITFFSSILTIFSLTRSFFNFDIQLAPCVQALSNIIDGTKTALVETLGVLKIIFDVAGAAIISVLCILIIILIVVTLILMIIPFSAGSGSWLGKKISEGVSSVMKLIKMMKPFLKILWSISKFVFKLAKFLVELLRMVTQIPAVSVIMIWLFPIITICMGAAIAFCERKVKVEKSKVVLFSVVMLVIDTGLIGLLGFIRLILNISIDFVLIKIGFIVLPAWYFAIFGHMGNFLGLCFFIAYLCSTMNKSERQCCIECKQESKKKVDKCCCCSNNTSYDELNQNNDDFNATIDESERIVTNTQNKSIKPINKSILQEIHKHVLLKDPETVDGLFKALIKKMFCFCFKNTDDRSICPYGGCEYAFPCCHDDDGYEDCCTKNHGVQFGKYEFEFDCSKPNCLSEFCNLKRIRLLFSRIILLGMTIFYLYFFFHSLHKPWVIYKSNASPFVTNITTDSTIESADDSVKDQKESQSTLCPFIDLSAVITAALEIIGGLFGFLGVIFPPFKILAAFIEALKRLVELVKDFKDLFTIIIKIGLLFIPVSNAFSIISLCFGTSISKYVDNLSLIVNILFSSINGLLIYIYIPFFLFEILQMIPLIEFEMILHNAYYMNMFGIITQLVTILMMIVDNVAPPIDTVVPLDLDDEIMADIQELEDPMHVNTYIEEAENMIIERIMTHEKNYTDECRGVDDDMAFIY